MLNLRKKWIKTPGNPRIYEPANGLDRTPSIEVSQHILSLEMRVLLLLNLNPLWSALGRARKKKLLEIFWKIIKDHFKAHWWRITNAHRSTTVSIEWAECLLHRNENRKPGTSPQIRSGSSRVQYCSSQPGQKKTAIVFAFLPIRFPPGFNWRAHCSMYDELGEPQSGKVLFYLVANCLGQKYIAPRIFMIKKYLNSNVFIYD